MSNQNTCMNCRWGIRPASDPSAPLECRFSPPVPAIIVTPGTGAKLPKAVWAIVDDDDWCASWNKRTEPGFNHP